jgi:hypothetical protein
LTPSQQFAVECIAEAKERLPGRAVLVVVIEPTDGFVCIISNLVQNDQVVRGLQSAVQVARSNASVPIHDMAAGGRS